MAEPSGRTIVERYARALQDKDLTAQEALLADDFIDEMPQSGERVRGKADWLAIGRSYPGGVGTVDPSGARLVGSEDRWVLTPTFAPLRIEGSGDVYTYVGSVTYANGETWQMLVIIELRRRQDRQDHVLVCGPVRARRNGGRRSWSASRRWAPRLRRRQAPDADPRLAWGSQGHPPGTAGDGQVTRSTVWPSLPSITVRLPSGSFSLATDAYSTPSPVDAPSWKSKLLTMMVTVVGVSVTLVTRTHAPGPLAVPTRRVWSSTT